MNPQTDRPGDEDRASGVDGLRITCSFCGLRDTPDQLAEHWCDGRTAFVHAHGHGDDS